MPRGSCKDCGIKRGKNHVCDPVPPPVFTATPLGPTHLLRQYLLWHAVSICDGRCIVCTDTIAYLGADVPTELGRLLRSKPTTPGLITAAQTHFAPEAATEESCA